MIKVKVISLTMSDVEDPILYAAEPLLKWERSEAGKWVMENSSDEPTFHIIPDPQIYGYKIIVTALLTEQNYIFWKLKYE